MVKKIGIERKIGEDEEWSINVVFGEEKKEDNEIVEKLKIEGESGRKVMRERRMEDNDIRYGGVKVNDCLLKK